MQKKQDMQTEDAFPAKGSVKAEGSSQAEGSIKAEGSSQAKGSSQANNAEQLNISVNNKKSILPYAKATTLHIKKLMVEHEMTYDDIVASLEQRGVVLSSSNLRNKVSGNALSAGLFFLIVEIITSELDAHINVKS